jgi:hypothetical protein
MVANRVITCDFRYYRNLVARIAVHDIGRGVGGVRVVEIEALHLIWRALPRVLRSKQLERHVFEMFFWIGIGRFECTVRDRGRYELLDCGRLRCVEELFVDRVPKVAGLQGRR